MTRPGWSPTIAHVRSTTMCVALALAGALLRRPDLVVVAVSFGAVAVWSVARRPRAEPVVAQQPDHRVLREGEATTWRLTIESVPVGADVVGAALDVPPYVERRPSTGAVAAALDTGPQALEIALRSTRWGSRPIGPATVVASSAWAAFRWSPRPAPPVSIATLPLPAVFDARPVPVHAQGLVGLDRSGQPGDGSEFAGIRPFQSGDRLRRVHWPRSLRTGQLHVTTTWADHDRQVVLLVDAFSDVGASDGIDGRSSSLDTTVRAAGALAEHHVRRGDRVALEVMGARPVDRVPPATGSPQLRRILDRLTVIEPAAITRDDPRRHLSLPPGALVLLLSPLVSPTALERAIAMARRGITVAVVDTLPPGITDDDPADPTRASAWRIRLLERHVEVRRVQELGVPVVAWRGPGSLDEVLRDLHRRARAPRMARR